MTETSLVEVLGLDLFPAVHRLAAAGLVERTPGAVAEGTRKCEGCLEPEMDRDQVGQFHCSRDLILLIRVGRAFDHLARHYADPTQPIQEGWVISGRRRHILCGGGRGGRRGLGPRWAGRCQASQRQYSGPKLIRSHLFAFLSLNSLKFSVAPAGTLIWLIELYQLALSAFQGGEGIRNGPFLDYHFPSHPKSGHGAHKHLECGECRLKPSLCDPLPVYIVRTIDAGYPSVQYMGLCFEVSVEIFIHQCGSCLSSCGCAITAVHRQMTLRRHVSRKCDTHRLELREAIGDRQCRWGIKRLATCYVCLDSLFSGTGGAGASIGYALICPVESSCGIGG